METYLFSYEFEDARYLLNVKADSQAEALGRVRRMSSAIYDGVLVATIPVALGPLAKLWVWAGNFLK